MPELPEVETVVRDLRPLLVRRTFTKVSVGRKALRRKWSRTWEAKLLDRCVAAIERRGKWIQIDLGGPWLLVHLGMTGQFTVVPAVQPIETHTHIIFTLSDSNELRFRDVRRFGSVTLFPNRETLLSHFEASGLGPEPFDIDADTWRKSLRASRRNLKAILLDQTIVAGVGNIYADESLFAASLHPSLLGSDLGSQQAEMLRLAMVKVLTRAIERRGSSIRDYIGGSGLKGKMQEEFGVYGRTGEACPRCGTTIEKTILAGRSTHFCPRCQKAAPTHKRRGKQITRPPR
ncbi:MAG TPA: bifunctional DNA-formamidopyrimidine glycosylase/DNA-(apurinic or apyrimidinic site) lyase [Gemmataceae bacterium]|nr:bifunctional DNA-formamidopyrimidine glycosylase/DNA-(apurinic or apyrimidinic site) lyase [Gemmataceae bacterium]